MNMILYVLKIILLFLFSIFVGYNYYFVFSGHTANFDGYSRFFTTILIIYVIYKGFQFYFSGKKREAEIPLHSMLWLFLGVLFVLCLCHFSLVGGPVKFGFSLFFKIIFNSLLPILVLLICTGFGKFITKKLPDKEDFGKKIFWLFELGLGFISFITLLTILGIFGLYNIYVFLLILIIFSVLSYKEIVSLFKSFFSTKFKIDLREGSYLKTFVTDFFYLLGFIVLGIALIIIYRPFPIGWDDLGVYMNVPHLMAQSGSILPFGGMHAWQVFTGIGYMFNSPTLAFFFSITSLFLVFITIIVTLSDLINSNSNNKKTFLSLPIILSTIYISLPMVTFHAAKDVKVDEGFLFLSIIGLYYLYKYFLLIKSGKNISIIYIFLIGIIIGFCFSVKLTALLLILGILGAISYSRLGISGLIGYIFIFFGVFTAGNLWPMMNVIVNPNNIQGFELYSGLGLIIGGICFLFFSFFRKKKSIFVYTKEILLFLAGIIVVLIPWFGKNIYESYPNFSIGSLISGKSASFDIDYTKLYTEDEYLAIKDTKAEERKKENLVTTDEDLLRYFGYENGILNYVNIFWNLTMQKNQAGEYTTIGFLFLAFLPLIFIFLPYKNKYYFVFFIFIALAQFIFYTQSYDKPIEISKFANYDEQVLSGVIQNNDKIFQDKFFNEDIYDINLKDYYSRKQLIEEMSQLESIQLEAEQLAANDNYKRDKNYYLNKVIKSQIDSFYSYVRNLFYTEIRSRVLDSSLGKDLENFAQPLSDRDYSYIQYLNSLYSANKVFVAEDIVAFKEQLQQLGENESQELVKLWKENRTITGKFVDFFAGINIPLGYLYLFLGFLIPTLYLLFTLKKSNLNSLFKLNLIFTFIYVFLWLVSSFGIVWYGITMYYSFLLMIGVSAYYIVSYKEDDEKSQSYFAKLFGSIVFLAIVLFYVFNSAFPYLFSNLKSALYDEYKAGIVSQAHAIFYYQPDYKTILFTLNIDESKRTDFFKENIDSEIYKGLFENKNYNITEILDMLKYLENDANYSTKAKISTENIYKGIINPKEDYKNKKNIYRLGTFLKYYISENNVRMLEDNLLFEFDDYIYSTDQSVAIDRLKNLGLKYILVDLNSATIDQSINHDLTRRYENLLKTLVSPKLELISTDSICLQIGLDLYKQNKDIDEYLYYASTNHESYDKDGNTIYRSEKHSKCIQLVNDILDKKLVNEDQYAYLLPYQTYFETNEKTLEKLSSLMKTSYKALFEIK